MELKFSDDLFLRIANKLPHLLYRMEVQHIGRSTIQRVAPPTN